MGRPPSPTLITLGRLVRRYRDEAGILQSELAAKLGYSTGWLSNLETGQLRPRREQVTAVEQALRVPPGVLMTVLDQLDNETTPDWFQEWREVEEKAGMFRWVELSIIPGLLQTPEYAAGLLHGDEAAIRMRLERQELLVRESPPALHCVIDEAVLYQERGGPEAMREQLMHLVGAVAPPHRTIQVVRSAVNPRSLGAFIIATLDGRDVAYLETAVRGLVTSRQEDLEILRAAWESIRAFAMSQPESIEFIRKVAEERWS